MGDTVGAAISNALHTADEMVTRWCAVIETIDGDGQRAAWLLCNDDAKPWDNLGLLAFATQAEQAKAVWDIHEDDEP